MNKLFIRPLFLLSQQTLPLHRLFSTVLNKERELLSEILSEVKLGLTLQHLGSYRELLMLKEAQKLN